MAGYSNTLVGFGKGNFWNEASKSFEIKKIKAGDWLAVGFGINVSSKDKEGNRVYGKPVDVIMTLNGKDDLDKIDFDSPMVLEGFYVPNNWTNKEGKEIKGNQFKCTIDGYKKITMDELTGKGNPVKPADKPADSLSDDELPW